MKTVRNGFCLILALIMLMSFSSCKKEEEKSEEEKANIYTETVFKDLDSFTEVVGIEPTETDKSNATKTVYSYQLTDYADQEIKMYKDYLVKYGFVADEAEAVYTYEEKTVVIETETNDTGVLMKISLPCDEKTQNSRNETIYKEVETAFNNKEYEKVDDILERLSGEYKESAYYETISGGILEYNAGFLEKAYESFKDYAEDPLVKTYYDEIVSYNGVYRCDDLPGVYQFILIKNGSVGLEIGSSSGLSGYYKQGDPTYYTYELIVRDTEKAGKQLMIGTSYSAEKGDYDYAIFPPTTEGDKQYLVISYETNKYDTFNGSYDKLSNEPVPAK